MKKIILIILFTGWISSVQAQLERKLANENQPVELTFHAPRHINLLTVEPLSKKTMHFAIMHTFGTLDGGIENLFGLDNGANIQLSFEFGLSDKLSLGFARSSQDKFYQAFGRYHLIQQTQNNSKPISVSLAGGAGVVSNPYSFLPDNERPNFSERLAYSGQVMLARRFSPRLSAQLTPMMAYWVKGALAGPLSTAPDGSKTDPWQVQVKRLFEKRQLLKQPECVQTEVKATNEPLTLATRVRTFSTKSQEPEFLN